MREDTVGGVMRNIAKRLKMVGSEALSSAKQEVKKELKDGAGRLGEQGEAAAKVAREIGDAARVRPGAPSAPSAKRGAKRGGVFAKRARRIKYG